MIVLSEYYKDQSHLICQSDQVSISHLEVEKQTIECKVLFLITVI